jgi:prephenate dehydratase
LYVNNLILLPQTHDVNLAHIESRSSKRSEDAYEFMVEIDFTSKGDVPAALEELKERAEYFQIISRYQFIGNKA